MKIRVYYEDTDCGNVVYYANYLKYMERSRTEYLREKGVELEDYHKQGHIFAVTEVNVKYRKPARYNDILSVKSRISAFSSVTMTFDTTICNQDGRLLVEGRVKMVCIEEGNGKVCKIPDAIYNILEVG